MFIIWEHLGLPSPTPAQYSIAYFLQHSPRRCIVEAFRGVGKSYITVAFVVWKLYKDPQIKIMVVSAGKDRADAFSIFVKSLLRDVPMLQHLQPDPSRGQRDSNIVFDVGPATPSGSPSVKSVGISSQLTGSRADLIVADDIEIPSNSATNDLREKLQELVKEFSAVLSPDGKVVYLGTPQTELSLYNVLETRGYQTFIYPARYPSFEQRAVYGPRLAEYILDQLETGAMEGETTDPLRFTNEDLLERELEYGKSGFSLQFMLDTSLSDANKYPLKVNDLIISAVNIDTAPDIIHWSNNPLSKIMHLQNVAMAGQYYYGPEVINSKYNPYNGRVLVIDPSGRGKDETGVSVALMASGNIYIPYSSGLQGGYSDETLIEICNVAKKYKVNSILIESNFGDGAITQLLTPHMNRIYPCSIEEVRQSQQKELRIIETLEPVMNQHRLIIDPSVIDADYKLAMTRYSPDIAPQYMLFYQMARISKSRGALKHDDRLDALAMAVKYFQDRLGLDQKAAESQRQQDLWDKEIETFILEMGGSTQHQPLRFHERLKENILRKR
jgi:hypothetical protein